MRVTRSRPDPPEQEKAALGVVREQITRIFAQPRQTLCFRSRDTFAYHREGLYLASEFVPAKKTTRVMFSFFFFFTCQ